MKLYRPYSHRRHVSLKSMQWQQKWKWNLYGDYVCVDMHLCTTLGILGIIYALICICVQHWAFWVFVVKGISIDVGEGDVATHTHAHTGTKRQGHKDAHRQRGIAHTDPQFQTDDRATSVFDGDPQRHKETGTHKHTQSEK